MIRVVPTAGCPGKDERSKFLVGRPDAGDLPRRRIVRAYLRHAALQFWAHRFDQIALFPNQPRVIDGERDFAPGGQASNL